MEPLRGVAGIAAHLPGRDINTDIIIPTNFIIRNRPEDLGRFVLAPLRLRPDGSENPDFVLNRPAFRGAPILIVDDNFGCGSSREFAASALRQYGIKVLIGTGFGPIFYNNCFQHGLLPVMLPAPIVEALAAQAGGRFAVDLEACRITPPEGGPIAFEIDPLKREQLLAGLDAIGLAVRELAAIEAFQANDRLARPWVYELRAGQ